MKLMGMIKINGVLTNMMIDTINCDVTNTLCEVGII